MTLAEKVIISPLKNELIKDINQTNDSFKVFGRVVPSLQSGKWSYEEILFDEPKEIRFPDDHLDWHQYISREDKALFLAYVNTTCIGQIRIIKDWNRFCYIENIAIKKEYRGYRIGKLLLHRAEEWASQRNLIGMSLEAQDDNLGACRFYVKQGFVLGGVDTLKQSYNPNIETTLYWYKLFEEPLA
ncbi:GNAT family N-acetyltransferase [Pullulanibacillus sp. KACC 23026]|uniref:GNAT family N-acetyltransferase n=1 Tax=Pullulanibacillus sp. KACC 23026 TaxID=3028315 RepID=UPI0023B085EF|nr:GNAT family N-acetyltransferase [Pullulanibacillus sp. KACC 23026]WEG13445.1 GNAT family N-acetyltransferase [Pullulanibacillus sp. KACC 23026]